MMEWKHFCEYIVCTAIMWQNRGVTDREKECTNFQLAIELTVNTSGWKEVDEEGWIWKGVHKYEL